MKKGFTLIELLAVIVILAIIALIATPIILNIINNAKSESNERTKELYLDAVKDAIARKNLTEEFNPKTCTVNEDGNLTCDVGELIVEVNGIKPISGDIMLERGKIIASTLVFSDKAENSVTKICSLKNDENGDGIASVGDLVQCGTEKFYVVPNKETTSEDKISLLSELGINTDAEQVMKQSSSPIYEVYGEEEKIKNYLSMYDTYLKSIGIKDVEVTLISMNQLNEIGCEIPTSDSPSMSAPGTEIYGSCKNVSSYVTSMNYMLDTFDRAVEGNFIMRNGEQEWSYLRPLIIINKSEL